VLPPSSLVRVNIRLFMPSRNEPPAPPKPDSVASVLT
jgi:hypothetical protein